MIEHPSLGIRHPDAPEIGSVVICTDKARRLKDPEGYRVESVGWSNGSGHPYGTFCARGVQLGGLYRFNVDEWEYKR
jgi:hypothetical protein